MMKEKSIAAWPALMSVETAAKYVGLGKTKFREILSEGKITKHNEGRRVLIRRDDLDLWIDQRFPASGQLPRPTNPSAGGAPPNSRHGDTLA